MAIKNILAATDFVSGKDNRYRNAVVIGKVVKLECTDKGANMRVQMPEKLDRKGNPLITKPIPMLQVSAGGKRSFAMPRIGQNVLMVKRSNGTGDYLAVGHFYTSNDPPPVTDPMLDYTVYDDGSIKQFDASKGTETHTLKGDTVWNNDGKAQLSFKGDVLIHSDGTVTIEGPTQIHLKGPMKFEGDITHIGNMSTTGIHTAADGPHASCGLAERDSVLDNRIKLLEATIVQLNARLAALEASR